MLISTTWSTFSFQGIGSTGILARFSFNPLIGSFRASDVMLQPNRIGRLFSFDSLAVLNPT